MVGCGVDSASHIAADVVGPNESADIDSSERVTVTACEIALSSGTDISAFAARISNLLRLMAVGYGNKSHSVTIST